MQFVFVAVVAVSIRTNESFCGRRAYRGILKLKPRQKKLLLVQCKLRVHHTLPWLVSLPSHASSTEGCQVKVKNCTREWNVDLKLIQILFQLQLRIWDEKQKKNTLTYTERNEPTILQTFSPKMFAGGR